MVENRRSLIAHTGEAFEHWRRRCLAAFGVVVVDNPRGED
jgi:predicted MarR family transcription regulator